jgi:hypothetical protein
MEEVRISSRMGLVALVTALLAAAAGPLACSGCSELLDRFDSAALATYRVTLEGHNYVLQVGDEQRRVGFSATRIVQARSSDVAAEMAIELVEQDKIWAGKIVNNDVDEASDRPRLRATQVEEIDPREVETGPGAGFDYDFYDDFFDDSYHDSHEDQDNDNFYDEDMGDSL